MKKLTKIEIIFLIVGLIIGIGSGILDGFIWFSSDNVQGGFPVFTIIGIFIVGMYTAILGIISSYINKKNGGSSNFTRDGLLVTLACSSIVLPILGLIIGAIIFI